jgi:hypothetical protein
MAIEYIQAVWELSPYKAEKLLVQLACADWANANGEFWPSLTEIAKKARLSKPGVIGIFDQFKADGEVVLLEAHTGRGNTNRYQFGPRYLEAVSEIRDKWQSKRAEKGKPGRPFNDAQSVNENIKRVNEEEEKGKPELAHIRKNRHEPSSKEPEESPRPVFDLGTALEDSFPGHATNIRTMKELYELAKRVQGTAEHVRGFEGWLAECYPMKANGIFTFKDLFPACVKAMQNGYIEGRNNGTTGQNRTFKTAGERAAESTIRIIRELTDGANGDVNTELPGFEWMASLTGSGFGHDLANLDGRSEEHPRQLTQGKF